MFKKLNLFSKTEMKVLSFISGKDGPLYERQIADGAGVSTGSANSILKGFAKSSLVTLERKGKMLFYQRNDRSPVLRQFKVFAAINGLMPVVGRIAPICQRIVLFGSCAAGRDGENSDIDLLVLSREKEAVRRILAENGRIRPILLSSTEYALLSRKDRPLYDRINAGIEIWGGENG